MNAPQVVLPPHSIEAEQSILAALMVKDLPEDNRAWSYVADKICAEDFYSDAHRRLFLHICALLESGRPAEVISLGDAIETAGELEQCGGRAYFGEIADAFVSVASVPRYVEIVREKSLRRRALQAAMDLHEAASKAELADTLQIAETELAAIHDELAGRAAAGKPAPIAREEMRTAKLCPECIVDRLLWADVGLVIAPGSTGKTTSILFMAIHIILGLPLFGREIKRSGPFMLITAEDRRETIIARAREIVTAMRLGDADMDRVCSNLHVWDVSDEDFRLTHIDGDVVKVSQSSVRRIVTYADKIKPSVIVLDPAVSFGVGESRVNDAEQGLIMAARALRNRLNCCVEFVHHTGKQNAREKTTDQYSGRNGSAMPDGARMVAVMQPMTPKEWEEAAGFPLTDGETGIRLALPKLTWCAPQPDILIARKGYTFRHFAPMQNDPQRKGEARQDQIVLFLDSEARAGRHHTQNTLQACRQMLSMSRDQIRDAVAMLIAAGRLGREQCRSGESGGAHTYLVPVAARMGSRAPN